VHAHVVGEALGLAAGVDGLAGHRAGRDRDAFHARFFDGGLGGLRGHVVRADDLLVGELVLHVAAADEAGGDHDERDHDQHGGGQIATDREELGTGASVRAGRWSRAVRCRFAVAARIPAVVALGS
jgi:hypothetical protein